MIRFGLPNGVFWIFDNFDLLCSSQTTLLLLCSWKWICVMFWTSQVLESCSNSLRSFCHLVLENCIRCCKCKCDFVLIGVKEFIFDFNLFWFVVNWTGVWLCECVWLSVCVDGIAVGKALEIDSKALVAKSADKSRPNSGYLFENELLGDSEMFYQQNHY